MTSETRLFYCASCHQSYRIVSKMTTKTKWLQSRHHQLLFILFE